MGKFERMAKRREEKEQRRKIELGVEKQIERKKQEHKMATWRRDQQGNIIFKGALKISRTALIALISVTIIVVVFTTAIIMNDETAGVCANPFCQFLGIEEGDVQYAPPTSGITEERTLP